ncbi:cyanate hydratase [Lucifera butyrica]|uniref:Cyanate hydratase n=1 Tax=Lucifera butyrica TaxID=1351585 RepID=A0A498R9F9_9FIRM|nr:cyanase [Lucifera butyrica]VBB07587.1 cyanate hydratase [Lucifera butyrica]
MSATPVNNRDYLWDYREKALAVLEKARLEKGLSYEEIAKKLEVSKVWLASTFKGQQFVPADYTEKLATILGLSIADVRVLQEHPYKGNVDPILYRLHEVFDTYGPAIKAIIHEKFGDGNGIMSAIDFSVDVEKVEDPKGDRVVITFNGKFLPYSCKGKYPW